MERRKTLKFVIYSGIVATVLSGLILIIGRKTVSVLFGVSENFYLKYYYDIVNLFEPGVATTPDSLIIFNIQNYRNRADLAKIINKIYECEPAVIGVDAYLNDSPDIIKEINSELLEVINKTKDKTIYSCKPSSDEHGLKIILFPFFYKHSFLKDASYTSSIGQGFYDYYLQDDTTSYINNNSKLSKISYEIAKQSGKNIHQYKHKFYINYSYKDFSAITFSDTLEITPYIMKNRIILIGDVSEQKDMATMPFNFGEKEEISGVENVAYAVLSLIENQDPNKRVRARYIGFQDFSIFISILISLLLACLFSFLDIEYEKSRRLAIEEQKKYKSITLTLLKPVLFIIIQVSVILFFYCLTFWTNKIPDLFLSMISISLVGISIDLTNIILK